MRLVLALVLAMSAVGTGCTVDGPPPPRDAPVTDPSPEQVGRALRFAAMAPLPPVARVPRLEVEGGIDTRVAFVVETDAGAAGAWLATSGVPSAPATGERPQQRLANPDGATVYRDVAVTVPAPGAAVVEVSAFTT